MASIWLSRPPAPPLSPPVRTGQIAPHSELFQSTARLRVVAFLRHTGCPFAENTVKQLRPWADQHRQVAVFVVCHGDAALTEGWIQAIGGLGRLHLVTDPQQELYAQWGVGYASFWHFGGLPSLLGVVALWTKGIRNRGATGTRWQKAAMFLLDGDRVAWSHAPQSAQELMLPPADLIKGP
jgi:hypothetical protein